MSMIPRARFSVEVEVGAALNLVGVLLKYLSPAFLFPIALALGYSEPSAFVFVGAVITALAGWGLESLTRGKQRVGLREGFLVVSLTWLLGSVVDRASYILSGEDQLSRPVDELFEAMSGMTTTGSSVVADVTTLATSLSMWRQFTQWFGGMGILVLALAVLPRLRVGGRQLMESEAPGPELEALTSSIRDTARRLWILYVALSALMILILAVFGWTGVDPRMHLFDATGYAFSAMPTGGFGVDPRSLERYAPASQWVIALFMAIAGANFALLYRAFVRRKPVALARDEEFRLYVGLLVLASLLTLVLWDAGISEGEEALRQGRFRPSRS